MAGREDPRKPEIRRALAVDGIRPAAGWNAACATPREGFVASEYALGGAFEAELVPLLGWAVRRESAPRADLSGARGGGEEAGLAVSGVLVVGNRVALCDDVFWFLGYVHDKNRRGFPERFERELSRFEDRFGVMLLDGTIPGYEVRREMPTLKKYEHEELEERTVWVGVGRHAGRRFGSLGSVFEEERDRFGFGP